MAKKLLTVAFCAAALTGLGANVALAGEITGNGKSLKVDGGGKWGTGLHARSECAFSGREDAPGSPLRTQTPHAVWFGGPSPVYPAPGSPGAACNPTRSGGGES